jgi:hypothetical protein
VFGKNGFGVELQALHVVLPDGHYLPVLVAGGHRF